MKWRIWEFKHFNTASVVSTAVLVRTVHYLSRNWKMDFGWKRVNGIILCANYFFHGGESVIVANGVQEEVLAGARSRPRGRNRRGLLNCASPATASLHRRTQNAFVQHQGGPRAFCIVRFSPLCVRRNHSRCAGADCAIWPLTTCGRLAISAPGKNLSGVRILCSLGERCVGAAAIWLPRAARAN